MRVLGEVGEGDALRDGGFPEGCFEDGETARSFFSKFIPSISAISWFSTQWNT